MRTSLCLICIALSLAACTTQAWYEGSKRTAEEECRKQPPGAYQDCMARVNKQRYEDYEKEREGAKKP